MKKLLDDVAAFQKAYEAPCHPSRAIARASRDMPPSRVALRLGLVFEEFIELAKAHGVSTQTLEDQYAGYVNITPPTLKDIPEIADAIGDSIYVLVGMALEYGIPLDHVWQEIQDSNMKKFPGGKVLRRESDGKVLKPEGWEPPDIEGALEKVSEARWVEDAKTFRQRVEERADAQCTHLSNMRGVAGTVRPVDAHEYNILRVDAMLDILSELEQEMDS